MIILWLEILLSEVIVHALALSIVHAVTHQFLSLIVLVSINRRVASLRWTISSLVSVVSVELSSWSWTIAIVLLLLPHVVSEDLLGEETTTVDIYLLLNDLVANSAVPHVGHPSSDALSLVLVAVLVLLVWILNRGQILLLLVQVVLVHLFLELDVLLINSVDLLTEVLVLPLKSLDQLVLLFDLLNLVIVEFLLDLHLVPQAEELLGFWHDLHEGFLLSVACWLALLCLEGALAHLN